MSYAMNDYLIRDDENGLGKCMVPRGPWRISYADEISRTGIRCLRLSQSMGWSDDNIDFLSAFDVNDLDSIEVYSERVTDLSPLSQFGSLLKIGLQTGRGSGFRTSTFNHLRFLFFRWYGANSLDQLSTNLQSLKIDKYPYSSIADVPHARNLNRILIGGSKLTTMSGVEKFSSLKRVEILDARRLVDYSDVSALKKLESLSFHAAQCIGNLQHISNLECLAELELDNCGDIISLEPLTLLKNLRSVKITGNTTVVDGNLMPLIDHSGINRLHIAPRRHYVPKAKKVLENVNTRS